jgi:predicted Zn-dependent protease
VSPNFGSPNSPAQPAVGAGPASPPAGPQQAQSPETQSAIQDFQAGRYEAALTQLQQLTAADAGNGFAWLLASHAEFALHRFSDASISLRRALAVLPENQWSQILAQYRDYYRATRYTVHLRALETFASAHPTQPAAHLLLGYHYGFLGYRPQAVEQLKLATTDDVDRRLLAHFGGRPASPPPAVLLPAAPPPAPEVLEPPVGSGSPRAF